MPLLESSANPRSGAPPPTLIELPPALRADLLDPANWQEGLTQFAWATNLAVALTDAEGRLLGECLNPQPTWSLLHALQVSGGRPPPGCPFTLTPRTPCICVAEALAKGSMVLTHDRAGLVHFAVPLRLGEHLLGALVAGQVFDQYPEQLPLEHMAKVLGLSPQAVWQTARLEHLVKRSTLCSYGDLLATLGQTFLLTRYHTLIEADRLAEMRRLRDQIAETDRRKNEFLAMLGHELRNPLGPIRNAVQLLKLEGPASSNVKWARDVIDRQAQLMTRLVNDLLDVSRITSGKVQLQKEPVDVATVVAQAVEVSRPHIDARKQELTIFLPPEPVWVNADLMRLVQVVTNLLHNAAKYTEERGRLVLTVEPEVGEVALRLRDTGAGIAAEMLPRVFDLFTQEHRSLAHSQGGLGIGLTMVRSLVELHGGSVQAFSAGLGQGSEFVVRLPLVPAPPRREDAPEEHNGHAVPSAGCRILVVDDNEDAANTLALLLKMSGHDVWVAHTGTAALATALTSRPEVVLLDIGLPGMNGYEVARRLRKGVAGAAVQGALLVALTGYGQEDDRRRSEEAGFDHHIVKPVDPRALDELLAALESSRPRSPVPASTH